MQKAETEICNEEKDQENTEPATESLAKKTQWHLRKTEKILPETDTENITEYPEELMPDTESEIKKEECESEEITEKRASTKWMQSMGWGS